MTYEATGKNISKPPIEINHADLERYGDSSFRSLCPECNQGILPVKRDIETLELLFEDMCCLCGQRFIYKDLP